MSRGPGRIERMIEALFTSAPSRTFSTDELVAAVYRGVNRIEKKHRVGVLRAADKVGKRLGHWEKWQCERWGLGGYWNNRQNRSLVGRGAVYVNVLDVHSYAIGRLRTFDFAQCCGCQLDGSAPLLGFTRQIGAISAMNCGSGVSAIACVGTVCRITPQALVNGQNSHSRPPAIQPSGFN